MVMARRDGVRTASAPVTMIDAMALGGQVMAALARVPFRRPFAGTAGLRTNLTTNVTREVLRTFMGNVGGLPIEELRSLEQLADQMCGVVMPPVLRALGVEERPMALGGVPGLMYAPRDRRPDGVIVHLHGGGYVGTSPRMYGAFMARLCRLTRCALFVADYRLPPEFPDRASLDDAADVLEDLHRRGVSSRSLFLAGDSRGGGLATSLLLAATGRELHCHPAGLLLFSPEVELLLEDPAGGDRPHDIVPSKAPAAAHSRGRDPGPAYFDQAQADLSGIPPTFVSWGGDETFRDAIRLFVKRLRATGVVHRAYESDAMFHVFPIVMPWADESRRVQREASRFVRDLLASAPRPPADVTRG